MEIYTATAQTLRQGKPDEAEQDLLRIAKANDSPRVKFLICKLQAVLKGNRDPALADDPNLEYGDAVELQLLLETLNAE